MKQGKRIKTYHGVPIPSWRHVPIGNSMTLVFVMTGRIPSKKNELVAVVERKDAFEYMKSALKQMPTMVSKQQAAKMATTMLFKAYGKVVNSKAYQEWEAMAVETFKEQLKVFVDAAHRNGIIFPISKCTVAVKFYWKGKYRRDNSNKSEGLHDALVAAHILADDSDKVMPDTSQGARDYSEEILKSMAVIYITVPIKKKAVG
jgi:hypothetical protein